MAGLWSRIVTALRPVAKARRQRTHFKRLLRTEFLEGRHLMANDLVEITGTVYVDLDDDLVVDTADTKLSGVTVTLFRDGADDTTFNTTDDTQVGTPVTSDANGIYTFDDSYGITEGTYWVRQSTVTGRLQRSTQTVQKVVVSSTDVLGTTGVTIDDFSTGTQNVSASISGTDPDSDPLVVAGILGGERDLFVDAVSGTSSVSLSVNPGTGLFEFQAGAATTGTRTLVYDGADADAATVDSVDGLGVGGTDLTAAGANSGFKLRLGTEAIIADDSTLTIRVYSSATNVSIATARIPSTGGTATGDLTIPFSDFTVLGGTGANFAAVTALQFDFDSALSDNGQIDIISTAAPTLKTVNFANLNPMSIGNLVWQDLDNDGTKDTAEVGIQNVVVQLYNDTNNNNAYNDGVDTLVTTDTTDTNGLYSFTDLLPGNYLIFVAQSQFGTGQPLVGYATSSNTATDPDDDIDNDDNGTAIATIGVATAGITLTAGGEPVNDGDTDNNTNFSVDLGFAPQIDLITTKVGTPNPVVAGQSVTYTLTVTNDNDSPISATNVSLSDNIPDGIQITSVTGVVGTTNIPSGNITIPTTASDTTAANPDNVVVNIGTLVRNVSSTATATTGSQAVITVVGLVLASTRGTLANSATATADGTLINTTDDTATSSTTVNATNALVITKTDSPDPVSASQTVTYTIDVVNNGPSDATNVVITDNIPDGIQVTSVTGTVGTTNIPTGSITTPTSAGDTTASNPDNIVVNVGTLIPNVSTTTTPTPGSATRITVVATVLAGTAPGTLSNAASVVSTEQTTPVSTTADTTVTNEIDLEISKDTSPVNATAIAGQNLTYVLSVTNKGPSTATNVRVIDDLPAGVTVVSVTPTVGTHVTNSTAGDVVVEIPTLAAAATGTITIVVTVPASQAGSLVNSATIGLISSTGFTEPITNNNSDSLTTTVASNVDLIVTKAGTPSSVRAGENVTYTVTVTNDGPSNGSNVSLSDNIPDGIQVTSVTGTVGTTAIPTGSITIPTTASDTTPANNDNVVVNIGTLLPDISTTTTPTVGSQAVITIIGKVLPSTRTSISNVATATASGTLINTSNDSATASTTITAASGLTITKTDSVDPVIAGQTLTYTIDVTNAGPSDATTVNLTDNIPDGLRITSVSAVVGSTTLPTTAITIPASAQDDTAANSDNITVAVGTLIPNVSTTTTPTTGSSARISIIATVLPSFRGTLSNSASVVSTEQTTPQTATADTAVGTQLDLSIQKSSNTETASTGGTLTYTIRVDNAGPSAATNVVVSDQLPSQLTFSSTSASQGSSSHNAGVVTANLGTIAPGGFATVTINTTVNATSPITVTNVATVTASESEANTANNTATKSNTLGQIRVISGRVFLDEDHDERLGSVDRGLAGITLVLQRTDGTEVARAVSDANGNYSFNNVAEGNYNLIQRENLTNYEGSALRDGLNDIAGSRATRTANNTMSISLFNGDSTDNNFVWYRASLRHLCSPFDVDSETPDGLA